MRPVRFVWSEHGLILETPAPLSPHQRERARVFAMRVFEQRHRALPRGDRREAVARVLAALRERAFVDRPVPATDCERDLILT